MRAKRKSSMKELRADVEQLKAQLQQSQETLYRLVAAFRTHGPAVSRFLSLRAAGRVLGLGSVRIRQLVAAGALRTVAYPNGARRVPRSEIERIDAFGLELALRPVTADRRAAKPVPAGKTG